LDVVVQAPSGVEVQPPPFGKGVGDFLVRDFSQKVPGGAGVPARAPATQAAPDKPEDLQTWKFHYQLEPAHAGKHLIRSFTVEFSDKRPGSETKGEPLTLESEPIEIDVTSQLGDKTPSLADLTPMHAPMPLPPSPIWTWIAGGLGLALAAAALLFFLKRRKQALQAPAVIRSPEEIAHAELKELLAANLHGTGQFKEFYVRLTGIVRRYIEGTTGIHAPEQTTEEFLRNIGRVGPASVPALVFPPLIRGGRGGSAGDGAASMPFFTPERSNQLAQFLESADMVKYAAQLPSAVQVQEAIARAQEFIGLPTALRPMTATAV
jgi:hypothetical protein